MKKIITILLCSMLLLHSYSRGQNAKRCGYDIIHTAALKKNPNFDNDLAAYKAGLYKNVATTARKTTTPTSVKIPIVFHIVLDTAQINQLGGASGIADRINKQVQVINEDYNRQNIDSTSIPSVFKPLYQSVNIHFGLAKIDPNGNATNGWEILTTTATGFDPSTGDAKHSSSGGANAWDVTKYLNVWVINFSSGGVVGLTCPPSYTMGSSPVYPSNEMGVMLSYNVLGARTFPTEYFNPVEYDRGRSLTHELGHFFELLHIWGDDGGLCPWNGGKDDGIADTPPQADATYGSWSYPKYDACSTSPGTGIMFMNFMDYSDDSCMHMFTHDQDSVMFLNVSPGGESYSLTTHPELLDVPVVNNYNLNNLSIYPNPANGKVNIVFEKAPQNGTSISVINMMGQVVSQVATTQNSIYTVDLSGMSKGIYFVECQYANGKDVRKIVLQ